MGPGGMGLELLRLRVFAKETLPVGPAQSGAQTSYRLGLWGHNVISHPHRAISTAAGEEYKGV